LTEYYRVREILGSKNSACAHLGWSKATINSYASAVKQSDDLDLDIQGLRHVKYTQFKEMLLQKQQQQESNKPSGKGASASRATSQDDAMDGVDLPPPSVLTHSQSQPGLSNSQHYAGLAATSASRKSGATDWLLSSSTSNKRSKATARQNQEVGESHHDGGSDMDNDDDEDCSQREHGDEIECKYSTVGLNSMDAVAAVALADSHNDSAVMRARSQHRKLNPVPQSPSSPNSHSVPLLSPHLYGNGVSSRMLPSAVLPYESASDFATRQNAEGTHDSSHARHDGGSRLFSAPPLPPPSSSNRHRRRHSDPALTVLNDVDPDMIPNPIDMLRVMNNNDDY
jgi:hypothetical protein